MNAGAIVAFVLGGMFVFWGLRSYKNRNWRKDKIKEWLEEPQTVARITGTINKGKSGENNGYCYRAEILIDGIWQKAESWDNFHNKRTCENGEEVTVAYRPIKENKLLDAMMDTMVEAFTNESWDERKPRYHFKFMDERKYDNEGTSGSSFFFVGFGLVIILMGVLACLGVIE